MIKRICIFAASSESIPVLYLDEGYKLGQGLAGMGMEIIYGGGKKGIMGSVSSGALEAGGKVIGVIPQFMLDMEWGRKDIHELHEVNTMHEREARMMIDSDAIVALPGGIGTFEEINQAIAWKLLGIIVKPIYIVNINGYFDPMLAQFNQAIQQGFMRNEHGNLWTVLNGIDELLESIGSSNGINRIDSKTNIHMT